MTNIENNEPDLWPLTLKTFAAMPTHMMNICGSFVTSLR